MTRKKTPGSTPDPPGNARPESRERTPHAKLAAIDALKKLEKLDKDLFESFKPDIERRKKPR